MTELNVGPNAQFQTLAAAIAASAPGDTINVDPGTYQNDFATITHPLTILGNGGPVVFEATAPLPDEGAILTLQANVTIDGITFKDAKADNHTGTAIRYEGGNLTVLNCSFLDNDVGIFGLSVSNGHVSIEGSSFAVTGDGDIPNFDVLVDDIASLTVFRSGFYDTALGSYIKSSARQSTIEETTFDDGANVAAGYSIDLPKGGEAHINAGTIVHGAAGSNPTIIHFGGDAPYAGSSLEVVSAVVLDRHPNGVLVFNETNVVADINSITVIDVETIAIGPSNQTNNAPPTPLVLNGTPDPDTLVGGFGNDTLNGGDGDDQLTGSLGNDSMVGGAGNDGYTVDSSADAVVELSAQGYDGISSNVSYSLPDNVEELALGGHPNLVGTGNGLDNFMSVLNSGALFGLGGNDTLFADNGDHTLDGGDGNDSLESTDGDDLLFGQNGNDQIVAGDGNDTILGGAGNDTIFAGNGNDIMTGDLGVGVGNDSIDAGAGNDTVLALDGADTIIGGNGNDLIGIFNGTDSISAGAGNDVVLLADGTHTVVAGDGNDTVAIFGGNGDSILGGAGDDAFFSGGTNATLEGGAGSDVFLGGDGPDTFAYHNGFGPSDLIYLFAQGSDKIRLAANINGTGIATANDALTHVSATALNGIGPVAAITLGAEIIYVVGLQTLQASDFVIG